MKKAVFFDRDGTLIEERNYLSNPDQVVLLPGSAEAIRLLHQAGFETILVTNQSGVARGYFTEEAFDQVQQRFYKLLGRQGVWIDAAYFCPHHEKGSVKKYAVACECRKPKPGMALRAAAEQHLDLSACYMIGDKRADVEFGRNFGAKRSFLVSTGYGAREDTQEFGPWAECVQSVLDAAHRILLLESGKK